LIFQFLELKARCQQLEDTISRNEFVLKTKESELNEVKRKLGADSADQVGKVAVSESILLEKESEIMSLGKEKHALFEDLSKAHRLIAESREASNQKDAEAAKCKEDLQKSSQLVNDLEDKLRNVQKQFDCQRHNAESVKGSLEKKLKDQVSKIQKVKVQWDPIF
jgi:septal ring factor EnvC (AmiA/AmiB activator)